MLVFLLIVIRSSLPSRNAVARWFLHALSLARARVGASGRGRASFTLVALMLRRCLGFDFRVYTRVQSKLSFHASTRLRLAHGVASATAFSPREQSLNSEGSW
uniref:Secreted protein n=1 Tax=Chrysotila carterae TaxID=13221 RepID=A0A7S4F647_CHRCT